MNTPYGFTNQIEHSFFEMMRHFFRLETRKSFNRLGTSITAVVRFPRKEMMAISVNVDDWAHRQFAIGEKNDMNAGLSYLAHDTTSRMAFELMSSMETWILIAKDELSFKEIISIKNIEQRMVALKRYGIEKILHDCNAELVEKTKRGNELYRIRFDRGSTGNIFSQDAYYLKYSCPSTGRQYISGVPPEMGKTNDADACMAWKHGLSKQLYQLLNEEA